MKLSVVIPTRERAGLLRHCLETCVAEDYADAEFLVSDNASTDETRAIVAQFQRRDSRVRYVNPGKRLGMSEHWQFAIPQATGDYIMVIGDDDGLLPGGLGRAAQMAAAFPTAEALHWPLHIFYYPGLPDAALRGRWNACGGSWMQLRASGDLFAGFLAGEIAYAELPGIYYGFVRRDACEAAMRCGINGLAPDVFIATFLAATTASIVFAPRPVAMAGVSSASNGFTTLHPRGDKSRAGLLREESAISAIQPIAELSMPVDASIGLLQIDALVKLRAQGFIAHDTAIPWAAHVANVTNEMRSKVAPAAMIQLGAELDGLLTKLEALETVRPAQNAHPASACWQQAKFLTGRAPQEVSDIKMGTELVGRKLADLGLKRDAWLERFAVNLERRFLHGRHERLALEVALALRIFGCGLIYLCAADEDESGLRFVKLPQPARGRFQQALRCALGYYFVRIIEDHSASALLDRLCRVAAPADEDLRARLEFLMRRQRPWWSHRVLWRKAVGFATRMIP
jgi:hypothetical protein